MFLTLHRFVLAGCLTAAVGCNVGEVRDPGDDDRGGDADGGPVVPGPDAAPTDLQFAGIYSVGANGDALTASWTAALGTGAIEYTLFVTTVDDSPVTEVSTSDTTAVASGLPDGEYKLRVDASDSLGRHDDGGVVLTQLIGTNRVVKRSRVPLAGAADVWGEGNIIVVAGQSSGISAMVVDVTDVNNPQVISEIDNEGYVKDPKIGDGLLFLNDEGGTYGGRIFDFTDPANPVRLSRIGSPITSVHNIFYEKSHLYMTDNSSGGIRIVDTSDPENPTLVHTWYPPSSSVHDQIVVGGKMYAAWWSGFSITDVTDPSNPEDLVVHYYGGFASNCHSIWPTEDGKHVLTTDETGGGHIRVFDVADPDNVSQIAEYITDPSHIVHNVHIRGDYAFIAYYVDGLRVLDISNPAEPVEVGFWDEETGSGMSGTWGVWPFGEHVAVSSMKFGLIMVDFFPPTVTADGPWGVSH